MTRPSLKPGFSTVDPRTGTRMRLVEGNDEQDGMGWVLEVECPAGVASSIKAHLHTSWTETFEILHGSARFVLDGREGAIEKGESIVVPPGHTHVHPWNAGDGMMQYRQTNRFDRRDLDAVDDVLGTFATINGLAREGKVRGDGLPRNPLQFAATIRTLVKHEGFDATVPVWLQRVLAATLGRLAEALGYRAVDPKFIAT